MSLAVKPRWDSLDVRRAAAMSVADVQATLESSDAGLSRIVARQRQVEAGPNAVRESRAQALLVLSSQLRSPLLVLLGLTALASFFVGERTDAVIIGAILTVSVGLGFANEYRAAQAAESLHSQISHRCVVQRDGSAGEVDVVELVPGDVVELRLGEVVPADLRLVEANGLECNESVLTGESLPVAKAVPTVVADSPFGQLTDCALMGTVVQSGTGRGVVVATGGRTAFGGIAMGLGTKQPETLFQQGLRHFSALLVRVAAVLTVGIFGINVALHRPLLDALLFSLAIAVGISPQLLPAVVSTSLAAGSRQLARRRVLVKRLVCIEDLGDVSVLFTDKTGTLTDGRLQLMRALGPDGVESPDPILFGLLCNEATVENGSAVGGNPLDVAIWESPAAAPYRASVAGYKRHGLLPFDHDRRMASVVVEAPGGEVLLVVKGAPETVLSRCSDVSGTVWRALQGEFEAGNRVVAVACRPFSAVTPTASDECGLQLLGLLVFLDPPKADARAALTRLAGLGIAVKVVTGDNDVVAAHVCAQLGLPVTRVVSGPEVSAASEADLVRLTEEATVFARVSPDDKARIVTAARREGRGIGFLGDGVNDALALHAADVGISVDSATDIAKDAADVILLEKNLDVLADGVVGGRRIFANTIKYVLMGTSSNFGNMFSAAGASAFLSFLPMLPSQILLNNLLYDSSQLAIPTDNVDDDQLQQPSQWDTRAIRRFMLAFGPISSVFDFLTFAVMLWLLHANVATFRSGWFVESLATQTLVIFAIRTRRVPFFISRPSVPLALAAVGVVALGAALPYSPLAGDLGFQALPADFFAALIGMVFCYLVLVEFGKRLFKPAAPGPRPAADSVRRARRIHRRAARFSVRRTGPRV